MTENDSVKINNKFRFLLLLLAIGAVIGITASLLIPRGLEISREDAKLALLTPEDFAEPVIVVESIPISDQPSPIFGVPAVDPWHKEPVNTYVQSGADCIEDSNVRRILSDSDYVEVVAEVDLKSPDEYVFGPSHVSQEILKFKNPDKASEFLTEVKKGLLTSGCFTSEDKDNVWIEVLLRGNSSLNEAIGSDFEDSIYFSVQRIWHLTDSFWADENYWTATGIASLQNYVFLTQVTHFGYGEEEDKLLEKAFLNFESLLPKE
jgi:hypothetical protein